MKRLRYVPFFLSFFSVLIAFGIGGYYYFTEFRYALGLTHSISQEFSPRSKVVVNLASEKGKDLSKVENVKLHYSYDNEHYYQLELEYFKNEYRTIIKTENISKLYYYFTYDYLDKSFRYLKEPEIKSLIPQMNELDFDKVKYDAVKYGDWENSNNLNLGIYLPKNYPVENVVLRYRLNDTNEYLFLEEDYESDFVFSLPLSGKVNKITYSFLIKSHYEQIIFPLEEVTVENPALTELETEIQELIPETDTFYFSYRDTGGTSISIDGGKEVSSLSLIKIPVMIETYRQLEKGRINLTDRVERYGYEADLDTALRMMMLYSHNEATGAIIKHLGGVDRVNMTLENYLGSDIITYLDHTPGYAGLYGERYTQVNTATMDEFTELLLLMNNGDLINSSSSEEMKKLMGECFDSFEVRDIEKIKSIAMKTGYQPPTHYGLVGMVDTDSGREYAFGIYLHDYYHGVDTTTIHKVLEAVNRYVEEGSI